MNKLLLLLLLLLLSSFKDYVSATMYLKCDTLEHGLLALQMS